MKKVIILGGGFAGVQTAIELQKKKIFDVTLISDRDYMYLYPISIWIPTGEKSFDDVKIPLVKIKNAFGFNLLVEKVIEIKNDSNEIILTGQTLKYDFLVIAIGAEKLHHNGIENTMSICGKPETALDIKKSLDILISKGQGKIAVGFGGNPKDKSAVRGGPAFELIFNIYNQLKKKNLQSNFELNFFAPMASPGERMGKKALDMTDIFFKKYNIGKRFGKKIKSFLPNGVLFEDDSFLESDLTLFIPASTGHSLLKNSTLPLSEAGFIKIDKTCKVLNSENVYAIGDAAAIEGPDWKAKQGHIAELMGKQAAYNIYQQVNSNSDRQSYIEHLNIICIMDSGSGAVLVFRNNNKAFAIPLPFLGHWLKRGWGKYAKLTKEGIIPRLPGL